MHLTLESSALCSGGSRAVRGAAVVAAIFLLSACNVDDLVNADRPATVTDPEALKSHAGALAIYNGALRRFGERFSGSGDPYVWLTGMLTDELGGSGSPDTRVLLEGGADGRSFDGIYGDLQNVRIRVQQATGALQKYAPTAPKALTGEVFAIGGFTETMIGEAFCSGVPFSSAPFEQDIVFGGPLTTVQMFEHAVAQFDTALGFAVDDVAILNLTRVGRGRALLNLGRFADAAAAVSAVPTAFAYKISYTDKPSFTPNVFATNLYFTVSDREGQNGLNFVSANDPRVRTQTTDKGFGVNSYPLKYSTADAPVNLADGVEARLIEAEAALKANDVAGWLSKLNNLRATAITPAMAPLADPGNANARVDLTFRERAFWLFLTGHRLGDLRRLIRQYGRDPEMVFPTGPYSRSGADSYGDAVNAPIPAREVQNNPNVTGCLNRDA